METTLDVIGPDLAARLGEPVLHAQTFMPGGRWGQPTGWSRLWRKARKTSRLDDRLPTFQSSVLVVTETRVGVVEASTMSGAFALTDVFGLWPRDRVQATAHRTEMTLTSAWNSSGQNGKSTKVIRLCLQTPDGALWADLRTGSRESTAIAHALGAKVSPAKV